MERVLYNTILGAKPTLPDGSTFYYADEITRTWKNKDTVQIAFPMSLQREPINAAHPEWAALTYGPLVLMAIDSPNREYTRQQLLSAKRQSTSEWAIDLGDSKVLLKPFMFIGDETYRLYNKVAPASLS